MTFEQYNEDYFYFSHNGENWWDHKIFKDDKFLKFKDSVYWYFDNELNVEKLLVDFLCDDNGNDFEYNGVPLVKRVDLIICLKYKSGQNVSNAAGFVMEWLTSCGLYK